MRTMTKTKTSPRFCRPYPSRKRGWPLTTLVFQVAFLATFAHAVIDDACRGTCDKYPDHYCEGSWIASCDRCSPSTKNTKCIEYFEKLIAITTESPIYTPIRNSSRPTLQPITSSSDRITKGETLISSPSQNQTDPLSPNVTKPIQSHNDTKRNNRPDSGLTALGEEESPPIPIIIPTLGALVVMATGAVFVFRKQRKNRKHLPRENDEDRRDANREEQQELVGKPTQENGPVGGPSLTPGGQLYLQNEVEGNIKETAL